MHCRLFANWVGKEDLNKLSQISSVTDRLLSLVLQLSEAEKKNLLSELKLKLSDKRRRQARKPFLTVVDFATQGRAYREFIRDLSTGGVYIQTSGAFAVGQEIAMTFSFPGGRKQVRIRGHVVRVDDTGIGVEFSMKSDSDDQLRLKSFLEMI